MGGSSVNISTTLVYKDWTVAEVRHGSIGMAFAASRLAFVPRFLGSSR